MRRLALPIAGLVVASLLTACASAPSVQLRSSVEDGVRQSDALIAQLIDPERPGCSAAVSRDGDVVWAEANGLAELEKRTALSVDSEFDFASVSKQFTATALLLLAQDGTLSLSDSLKSWLPELPRWAEGVTLAELMNHTSGIPDYTVTFLDQGIQLEDSTSQADALREIAASEVKKPGAAFEYSNSNYVLLAEVIHAASGLALPEFLEDRIFGDSELVLDPQSHAAVSGHTNDIPVISNWGQIGDGSIVGTPSSLVLWADYYRSGQLGDEQLASQASAHSAPTGAPDGSSYGAGIMIGADGTLSHIGVWAGTVTLFGVSADQRMAVAVSCNSTDAPAEALAQGLRTIWQ